MEHSGAVIWFAGLSGSGKSTIAQALYRRLCERGCRAYVLDGDKLRTGLSADLGFSEAARVENLRRAAEVAAILADAGMICIVAFISPLRSSRERARAIVGAARFAEIHISTPLAECERRDCKGLYARARRGEIPEFTGISSPFEPPTNPDLAVDTSIATVDEGVARIERLLESRGFVSPGAPS